MDHISSFKGYGKVDEAEERAFRRRTRRRAIILIVSSILLLAAIIGAVVGIVVHKRNNKYSSSSDPAPPELTPSASLKAVCGVTLYPTSCFSSISALGTANITDPEVLFKLSLRVALNELSTLKHYPSKLIQSTDDPSLQKALNVCQTSFEDALDRVNDCIAGSMVVGQGGKILSTAKISDIKTWLSTALTDQETCLDALEELNGTDHFDNSIVEKVRTAMENSTEFVSNSLAIGAKIMGLLSDFNIPIHRRLLGEFEQGSAKSGFPGWVSAGVRRLLQESNPPPNVTVAKDGSGNYRNIGEAVEAIPKKSKYRFIIHVKAGLYEENVILDKNKWNVMMYGDGKNQTIVSGSLNFVDGTPTFATATVD